MNAKEKDTGKGVGFGGERGNDCLDNIDEIADIHSNGDGNTMSINGVSSDCDKININMIRRFKVEVELRTDISYTVNSQQREYEQESENEEKEIEFLMSLTR